MFKRNKIYTVVAASALMTLSAMSAAQQSVTTNTQVVVSNSFTVTKDSDLSFGTLAVIQNLNLNNDVTVTDRSALSAQPIYTVSANGTTSIVPGASETDTISTITEITPGTPATYTISNAARFTEVFVDLAGSTAGGPITFAVTPEFTVDAAQNTGLTGTLNFTNTLITAASANQNTPLAPDPNTAPIRTSGTGTASFAVGATLSPNVDARSFADGTYSGTFDVTVNY